MGRASAARAPTIVVSAWRRRKGRVRRRPSRWSAAARRLEAAERGGTPREKDRRVAMDTGGVREERTGGGRGGLDGVRRQLRTLPNQLTAARLALVPVLWGVALLGQPVWL